MLDLSSFENALAQLEKSLAYARSPLAENDIELFFQFRAATIQAFEYSYDLSIKTMKRFIETTKPDANTDSYSFKDLLREAWEYGLIGDIQPWVDYREKRNITSHTYNEESAAEVFAAAPQFLADALQLHDKIKKRQEQQA